MQYSYYSTKDLNLLFVKNGNLILINNEYDEYSEEYHENERSMNMIITEDTLKKNQELWLCYLCSLLLTEDISNGKNIRYKKIWCNECILPNYCDADINVTTPKIFNISSDFYVDEGIEMISDILNRNNSLYGSVDYALCEFIEEKILEIEEIIAECEMNVEKIRAFNNIVPDNFPKDIYDIIYKMIFF